MTGPSRARAWILTACAAFAAGAGAGWCAGAPPALDPTFAGRLAAAETLAAHLRDSVAAGVEREAAIVVRLREAAARTATDSSAIAALRARVRFVPAPALGGPETAERGDPLPGALPALPGPDSGALTIALPPAALAYVRGLEALEVTLRTDLRAAHAAADTLRADLALARSSADAERAARALERRAARDRERRARARWLRDVVLAGLAGAGVAAIAGAVTP